MKQVLIVEDSPTELHILRTIMEKNNFVVSVANNGIEGIEMVKRSPPDIILMDVVMPEMNGFKATRALKKDEATSHIPIIMVTTKAQETDRVWAMRQGVDAYLNKPVDAKELMKSVKELCP
ncbi:MAG: response regulator [Methylococcales bacterium]|jgi:twitching motility two-component system response regulator PilH|nr:response regulator [Methylococcales bacterium]MBT7443169.1 response regulator [Methylococcales bacterium]